MQLIIFIINKKDGLHLMNVIWQIHSWLNAL